MMNLEQIKRELQYLFSLEIEQYKKRDEIYRSGHSSAFQDEIVKNIDGYIKDIENQIFGRLNILLRWPPHHARHNEKLQEFFLNGSYEDSIFIMTKFPEGDSPEDVSLKKVINSVSESVRSCNKIPRIASDKQYHPLLWDNVELYLLGCSKGIAIVEDRYKPEFNPNVSLEWGWMRAMGKPVFYLVEAQFEHERADAMGFLGQTFDWSDPDKTIHDAIKDWLK